MCVIICVDIPNFSLHLQASPENVYEQLVQNLLYPSHTYSHVSGGHPLCILDLTVSYLIINSVHACGGGLQY